MKTRVFKKLGKRFISVTLTLTMLVSMFTIVSTSVQAGLLTNIITRNWAAVAFEIIERTTIFSLGKAEAMTEDSTLSQVFSCTKRILGGAQVTVNAELLANTRQLCQELNTLHNLCYDNFLSIDKKLDTLIKMELEGNYKSQRERVTSFIDYYQNIISNFDKFIDAFLKYCDDNSDTNKTALKTAFNTVCDYYTYTNTTDITGNRKSERELFQELLYGNGENKGFLSVISPYNENQDITAIGEVIDLTNPKYWGNYDKKEEVYLDSLYRYATSFTNFENNVYEYLKDGINEVAYAAYLYTKAYRYYYDFNSALIYCDPSYTSSKKTEMIEQIGSNFEDSVNHIQRAINQMCSLYENELNTFMRTYDTYAEITLKDYQTRQDLSIAYEDYTNVDLDGKDVVMTASKNYASSGFYQFRLVNENNNNVYAIQQSYPNIILGKSRLEPVWFITHNATALRENCFSLLLLNYTKGSSSPEGLNMLTSQNDVTNIVTGAGYDGSSNIINNIIRELKYTHSDVTLNSAKSIKQTDDESTLKKGQFMLLDTDIFWEPGNGNNNADMTWLNISVPTPTEVKIGTDDVSGYTDESQLDEETYIMFKGTPTVKLSLKNANINNGSGSTIIEVAGTDINQLTDGKASSGQVMTIKVKPNEGSTINHIVLRNNSGNAYATILGSESSFSAEDVLEYMSPNDDGYYEFTLPVPCQDTVVEVSYTKAHGKYNVSLSNPKSTDSEETELADIQFEGYSNIDVKRYKPGETVTVSVLPLDNNICESLIVTDDNGSVISVKDITENNSKLHPNEKIFSFTMPSSNVNVSAGLSQTPYTVSVSTDDNSSHEFLNLDCFDLTSISGGITSQWSIKNTIAFEPGKTVTITVSANENYYISDIDIYTDSRKNLEINYIDNSTISFIMPDENIYVNVSSERDKSTKYIADINYGGMGYVCFANKDSENNIYKNLNIRTNRYTAGEPVYIAIEDDENEEFAIFDLNGKQLNITVEKVYTNTLSDKRIFKFTMPETSIIIKINPLTISLNKAETSLKVLNKEQITATVLPETAYNKKVIWTSANPKIASVDENGVIQGVSAGETTITASLAACPKETATINVKVTADELSPNADGVFVITNYSELYAMQCQIETGKDIYVNGSYILANDITWPNDLNWVPIGSEENGFSGTFDGCGHTISNLCIKETTYSDIIGLFGQIEKDGVVKNLYLEGLNYTEKEYSTSKIDTDTFFNVGGICVINKGTISNCHTSGTISLENGLGVIGGICGVNSGIISDCSSACEITYSPPMALMASIIGGISAENSGRIERCYNSGNITVDAADIYVGGISGINLNFSATYDSIVVTNKDCYNTGKLTVQGIDSSEDIEAINTYLSSIGEDIHLKNMDEAYAYLQKECRQYIGGIVGSSSYSDVVNCYNIGEVSNFYNNNTGDLYGIESGDKVQNCYYLVSDDIELTDSSMKHQSQFESGEVTYLLNGGITDGTQTWYQNIDNDKTSDKFPLFSGGTVYRIIKKPCGGSSIQDTVGYSNFNKVIAGEHKYENGFCVYCDGYQPATLVTSDNYTSLGLTSKYVGYYAIENAGQLYWFSEYVSTDDKDKASANAVLVSDITVNKNVLNNDGSLNANNESFRSWIPIGGSEYFSYKGIFDGHGHTISGLYFNNKNQNGVALFIETASDSVIKNVGVIDSYFEGSDYVGSICLLNNGKISNCYSLAKVTGKSNVGGICVFNLGNIDSCYNAGELKSEDSKYVGSICANNYNIITNCYYLEGTAAKGIGYSKINLTQSTISKSEIQFESGEIAYLLNGGITDGSQTWYQNIDNGEIPNKYPVFSGGTVYKIDETNKTYSNFNKVNYAFEEDENGNFIIKTYDDLVTLSNLVRSDYDTYGSASYILVNNIVAPTDSVWTQGIGSVESNKYFNGTFDGNGYCIRGLNVQTSDYNGLFEIIGKEGTVKNLFVFDFNFNGNTGKSGGIASINNGTIDHCISGVNLTTGTIFIKGNPIKVSDYNSKINGNISGGIAGENNGSIIGSRNCGTVNAVEICGGVAGINNGKIYASSNSGSVGASKSSKTGGGIAGVNNGKIESSYSSAKVYAASSDKLGAIIGLNNSENVKNTYGAINTDTQIIGSSSTVTLDSTNKIMYSLDMMTNDFTETLNSVTDSNIAVWTRNEKQNKSFPIIKFELLENTIKSAKNSIIVRGNMHQDLNISYDVCDIGNSLYSTLKTAANNQNITSAYSVNIHDNNGNHIPTELWCQNEVQISVPVESSDISIIGITFSGETITYKPDSVENNVATFTAAEPMSFAVVENNNDTSTSEPTTSTGDTSNNDIILFVLISLASLSVCVTFTVKKRRNEVGK